MSVPVVGNVPIKIAMPPGVNHLRRFWLNIRLCIAPGVAVLLIPISHSGALLVWHDYDDALINSARYAVTGPLANSTFTLKKTPSLNGDRWWDV